MSAEDPEPQPCSGTSTPPTPPRARSPNPLAHLTPTKSGVSTRAAHVNISTQAIDHSPRRRPTPAVTDQTSSSEEESTRFAPASDGNRLRSTSRSADQQLVQVEGVTGNVSAVSADARSELRQQLLREQSWRSSPGRSRASSAAVSAKDVSVLSAEADKAYTPRRYYVLTNAGKPVFALNHGEDEDSLTNMMGVAQALISIFQAEDDKPRMIVHGSSRIVFNIKDQLYFFAVSDWGEPEYILRMHLEYMNLQILSVVSAAQLQRAFQRRSNFDPSRLLEGSEGFLKHLVGSCQDDLTFLTTTLEVLRMPPALRDTAASALMPPSKFKDLLYVLLIADGKIVTLLRPRRHAIHPADMHLLINMLPTSAALRSIDTWLPICLPKFNTTGFVHAYISYVTDNVGLVFISADRDAFESLSQWRVVVEDQLKKDGSLEKIESCVKRHSYLVGAPGLRHFVYKSRDLIQSTAPEWEEPYGTGSVDRKRIITLYQQAQDALYARSGQQAPLKLVYLATSNEAVLGWLTKPFELYIAVSPKLSMNAVVSAANRVAKWVAAEESRLFLKDAPVF